MLDNSLTVQIGGLATTTSVELSLNDIRSGTSVRSYKVAEDQRINLYVQNQTSKENPPVGGNRSRISVERVKVLSDGSERKVIASWTVSTPRDSTFTTDEINGTMKCLVGILLGYPANGDNYNDYIDGWHTSSPHGLDGATFVERIRAGEE
jgi:hypothetical protein